MVGSFLANFVGIKSTELGDIPGEMGDFMWGFGALTSSKTWGDM